MSTKRRESAKGRKAEDGTVLCSCGCGQKPPKGRRSWFSDACVHEWKIRNDPGYVRRLLEERDKGVCASCGVDCIRMRRRYPRPYGPPRPDQYDRRFWNGHAFLRDRYNLSVKVYEKAIRSRRWTEAAEKRRNAMTRAGWPFSRSTFWDADHIVEVVNGGGQCGLDNLQTLCVPCHKAKTKRLAAELAQRRRKPSPQPELVLA